VIKKRKTWGKIDDRMAKSEELGGNMGGRREVDEGTKR
jgi:hypothetical protein